MGGEILDYSAKRILNEGRAEGLWIALCAIVEKDLLSAPTVANQIGVNEADFMEKYEKYEKYFPEGGFPKDILDILLDLLKKDSIPGSIASGRGRPTKINFEEKNLDYEKGRSEGVWATLCDLVKKGALSISAAANQAGMSEIEFREKCKQYESILAEGCAKGKEQIAVNMIREGYDDETILKIVDIAKERLIILRNATK